MAFVQNRWINPDTIESREYQNKIVEAAKTSNTLVVLPTGLGKTPIAALVSAHCLDRDADKKILFLAPTKPLVEQHKATFEKFFKTGLEMKVITGASKPEERSDLYGKADIVFSTPQTIRNDIKTGRLSLNNYSLLIVDEAHRAVGNYAYPYVAKVFTNQAGSLILALTASPGSHKLRIDEIKQKLYIRKVEIRSREDSDVQPYIKQVKETRVSVELPVPLRTLHDYLKNIKSERIKKLMGWKIINSSYITKTEIIKLQQELAKKKSGFSFAAISMLAEILKIDHALLLLETQCLHSLKKYFDGLARQETKAVARLLKEENFMNAVRLTDELINEGAEHPKIGKLKEIVAEEIAKDKYCHIIVFAQFRDTIAKICESLKCIKNAAPVEFIGQAKKSGKGLSQKEQVQIINEFKLGFYNILVASQVGEEGLDITETDVVIFYEPTPSAIRKIQRSGRTARTRSGRVIVLMTKDTRDEAFHWSGFRKEQKMKKLVYDMQKKQQTLEDFGKEL
ncbi:MAG: DEAD/DEAH box helicase family protein [Candidatus Aenigmarchaeota archaeon]|nr:DEAD/DEAH box helicase family protein [Candidatus Aenigmarchaeota archaeon]